MGLFPTLGLTIIVIEHFANDERREDGSGAVGDETQAHGELVQVVDGLEERRGGDETRLPDGVVDGGEDEHTKDVRLRHHLEGPEKVNVLPLRSRVSLIGIRGSCRSKPIKDGHRQVVMLRFEGAVSDDGSERLWQDEEENRGVSSGRGGQEVKDAVPPDGLSEYAT